MELHNSLTMFTQRQRSQNQCVVIQRESLPSCLLMLALFKQMETEKFCATFFSHTFFPAELVYSAAPHSLKYYGNEQAAEFYADREQSKQELLKMASSSNSQTPMQLNLHVSLLRETFGSLPCNTALLLRTTLDLSTFTKWFQDKQPLHIDYSFD